MNTETSKPRLIDANSLIKKLEEFKIVEYDYEDRAYNKGIDNSIEALKSAPTVETTDDVMARFPYGIKVSKTETNIGTRYFCNIPTSLGIEERETPFFDTPLEALKKLEASLNPK